VAFIISEQSSNGSWGSVDLTAAAIQALVLVDDLPNVKTALSKARSYLISQQENDGGFGNTFATSWTMQAIKALGEDSNSWIKDGNTPLKYLASKQDDDGGLNPELDKNSRIWATSYLIPAYYEKTWDDLMKNFSKQVKVITRDSNSSNNSNEEVSFLELETEINPIIPEENIDVVLDLPILNDPADVAPFVATNELNEVDEATTTESSPNNNLQANVLGSVNDSGLLNIVEDIIYTTLAGIETMWNFVLSIFNF
jgi:hypothetical protein